MCNYLIIKENKLFEILSRCACCVVLLFLLTGISPVLATESPETIENDGVTDSATSDIALQEIMQLLEEESDLATRTRLNVDFVPGVMTVLHGSDLEARGVQTVHDALGLVPGIELSRTNDGRPKVLVRGIGQSFFSGKVKFLLNHTPFNGTLGATSTLFVLPIEQVERIEVIRGPGSAIYGEYASVGVVNVITRHEKLQGYLRATDLERTVLGGAVSHEFENQPLKIDFSFAGVNVEGGDVEVDNDVMRGTPISNAPGPINNKEEHRSFILNAYYNDYHFSWQSVEEGLGDFFGFNNALPSPGQRIVSTFHTQNFEVSRSWLLASGWDIRTKAGLFDFSFESEPRELFPPGFGGSFPDGVLGAPNYHDEKWYLNSEFSYNKIDRHELLLGVEFSFLNQGDTYVVRNFDPLTFAPNGTPPTLVKYTGSENWLRENLERRVIGLYFQDQFTYTDRVKFTGGIRFDKYDDIGSDITPRLAAVYQLSDHKTFKFQYAESFRPPTFLEMHSQNNPVLGGNDQLNSEHIKSLELGYVHNDGVTVFRATLFKYSANDLIQIDGATGQYENLGKAVANGLEMEYLRQVDQRTKIDANFSYINSEDDKTNNRIPGVANVLGNFAILYEPWPNYVISWQFKHVTYRQREAGDTRPDLDDYNISDLTANLLNFGVKDLTLRFGVRNMFDADVRYPAFMVGSPASPAYLDDYPQSGRELFLQFNYTLH